MAAVPPPSLTQPVSSPTIALEVFKVGDGWRLHVKLDGMQMCDARVADHKQLYAQLDLTLGQIAGRIARHVETYA